MTGQTYNFHVPTSVFRHVLMRIFNYRPALLPRTNLSRRGNGEGSRASTSLHFTSKETLKSLLCMLKRQGTVLNKEWLFTGMVEVFTYKCCKGMSSTIVSMCHRWTQRKLIYKTNKKECILQRDICLSMFWVFTVTCTPLRLGGKTSHCNGNILQISEYPCREITCIILHRHHC